MTPTVETLLRDGLNAMFTVEPKGEFMRVRTPFWYPDGGVVDVFVREHDGVLTLTDLGEALGWLRMQSLATRRSPKQQRLVQDICTTQGVELFRGQLMLRCPSPSPALFSACLVRLGQAAVRVSDLWFTTRTRSVESVTDEVADVLQEWKIDFQRGEKLPGRSGRDWNVDFHTRTERQSALVSVLASGSRAAARRVTEHVVAAWHDLSPIKTGSQPIRFVSLFDDTVDVWAEEDFRLVESVSDISRWSQPEQFEHLLRDAA